MVEQEEEKRILRNVRFHTLRMITEDFLSVSRPHTLTLYSSIGEKGFDFSMLGITEQRNLIKAAFSHNVHEDYLRNGTRHNVSELLRRSNGDLPTKIQDPSHK